MSYNMVKWSKDKVTQRNEGSSHFAGAHNFHVEHQFNIAPHGKVTVNINNRFSLNDELDPVLDATHTRDRKKFPPNSTCLPGTRDVVMKQIKSWADSGIVFKDDVSHVMWLYGYVGSGKSAIAQTIAETFAKKGRLAASFFFFRGSGDRSKSAKFVKTLASELASAIPSTAPSMKKAIQDYAGLLTTSPLELQFQHLFLDPFRSALRNPGRLAQRLISGPVVTVIDGLDECEDRAEVANWMERMAQFYAEHPRTPLRFFISSRVEEHIRTRMARIARHTQVQSVDLAQHGSEEDIALIVHETFKRAAEEDRVIRSYGNWPSAEDRRKLVRHADGSFILISTLLRFILETTNDGRTARDRLSVALNFRTGLDEMYTQILAQAEDLPYFASMISTIVLVQAPLSVYKLADLHHVEPGNVIPVLVNLHAVLQVPGDDASPVTLCHSSFREYLFSESRSGRFHVPLTCHRNLAHQCLEHMLQADSNPGGNTFAVYANSSFQFHWTSNIAARRDDGPDIRQELRDMVTRFLGTIDKSTHHPMHCVFVNYTLMDRQWVNTILQKSKQLSLASFAARFAGLPARGLPWKAATNFVQAVDHAVSALLEGQNSAFDQELSVIWEVMKPPISNLRQLLPRHTHLVANCISHLFARWVPSSPSPSEAGKQTAQSVVAKAAKPPNIPIVFLPVRLGNTLDVSDYAFWNLCHHLDIAINNDSDFLFAYLVAQRDPPLSRHNPPRETVSPFDYTTHQSRYFVRFDPGEKLTAFKRDFEAASSTIDTLLRVGRLLPSRPLPSVDDWGFKKSGDKSLSLVYGCIKPDYSILNMWMGYTLVAQCFIDWMEGSHDDAKCTLHRKYDEATRTER